jgi:hypothetical protein
MAAEKTAKDGGLRITPPFGYNELHALQKTDRVLLPQGATPNFCRGVNALAVSWGEFVSAARDYPIVFASSDAQSYSPVAIVGLADGQNLFITGQGEWEAGSYIPAFVRRYPFCIAKVMVEGKQRDERLVCVEQGYLDKQGVALYDAAGKPTAQWASYERLLQDYEGDLDLTAQMCSVLAKLGLFSPFQFQVMQGKSASFTMKGMHRIDEKKLAELKPASHKALLAKGLMSKIYAHIHSLENFARLYSRALARSAQEAKKKKEGIHR